MSINLSKRAEDAVCTMPYCTCGGDGCDGCAERWSERPCPAHEGHTDLYAQYAAECELGGEWYN